ncbi:MAG: DUF4826 family protein [Gammaproteobacteria bacterium]|nr:DUF4826 family protein [Gammaproteobacteria bacterium]NVK89113.1 DUF4826 family protein [Gammaproteobacteria bacterium]
MATPSQLNQGTLQIDWSGLSEWQSQQLMRAMAYCQKHGWQVILIDEQQSRELDSVMSLFQLTITQQAITKRIWLITGELPTVSLPFKAAANAREALVAFSRHYLFLARQIKQSNEFNDEAEAKRRMKANVKAAADLLVLYHESELWLEV